MKRRINTQQEKARRKAELLAAPKTVELQIKKPRVSKNGTPIMECPHCGRRYARDKGCDCYDAMLPGGFSATWPRRRMPDPPTPTRSRPASIIARESHQQLQQMIDAMDTEDFRVSTVSYSDGTTNVRFQRPTTMAEEAREIDRLLERPDIAGAMHLMRELGAMPEPRPKLNLWPLACAVAVVFFFAQLAFSYMR